MNITSAPFELNCPLFTRASEMRPQPALGQCLGGQEGQEVALEAGGRAEVVPASFLAAHLGSSQVVRCHFSFTSLSSCSSSLTEGLG